MEQQEQWLLIIGYEGRYEVSSIGRVKSLEKKQKMPRHGHIKVLPEHYLTLNIGGNSPYAKVSISDSTGKKKKKMVHRLVAIAFVPNLDNKPEVNHIDGDKLNNCASNLEWCTAKENQQHAVREGLHVKKLSECDVLDIRKRFVGGYNSSTNTMKLAKEYGISHVNISSIVNRKTWTHI